MKSFKPSKQTVLKGLLLLVVGLNFSWKPFISSDMHSTTMAESLPAPSGTTKVTKIGYRQKSGAEIAKGKTDPNSPFSKIDEICGRFFTLKLLPDGSHAQTQLLDSNQNEVDCEKCKENIWDVDPGLLKTDPNSLVDLVKNQLLPLGCDAAMSDKEKEDRKKAEEAKIALAQDKLQCLVGQDGKDLDSNRKLNCQLKNMNLSDKQMKDAGFEKDEADKIRKALAKDSLASIAKTCKASRKKKDDDVDFGECEELMEKYSDSVGTLAESANDGLAKMGKELTNKYTKLEKFVGEEKKAVERVDLYKAEYEKLNTQMEKAYNVYSSRCDAASQQATARGQDFDTDACRTAYQTQYVLPYFEPKIKNLTNKFTSEENKAYRTFDELSKVDIIGKDGRDGAIAPYREYTKTFATYFPSQYFVPQKDLPQFADATTPGAISTLAGLDLDGRLGVLKGARQFTPWPGATSATGATVNGQVPTANQVAFPNVIRSGYQSVLPNATRANARQTVTAGLILPVQNDDQQILLFN